MDVKQCPFCGKTVLAISKACEHCREMLPENIPAPFVHEEEKQKPETFAKQPVIDDGISVHVPKTVETQPISRPAMPPQYSYTPEKTKLFPWLFLIIGIVLLSGVGGYIGYSQSICLTKDRDAPRYYTFATNTFLRSKQMAVDYNVLAKAPYGPELLAYSNNSEWAEVKYNKQKGYYGRIDEQLRQKIIAEIANSSFIIISKEEMTLSVYDYRGALLYKYPVALGKNFGNKKMQGDMKTPEGIFNICDIQHSAGWKHDFGDGKGEVEGAYGPYFIRLLTPGHKGIGIHGTHLPNSVGLRVTEGCIRLNNKDLEKLVSRIHVGDVVVIIPSKKDLVE
jgi:lipoprotein-anchoring transpeptidase ErfK/SrfK